MSDANIYREFETASGEPDDCEKCGTSYFGPFHNVRYRDGTAGSWCGDCVQSDIKRQNRASKRGHMRRE